MKNETIFLLTILFFLILCVQKGSEIIKMCNCFGNFNFIQKFQLKNLTCGVKLDSAIMF